MILSFTSIPPRFQYLGRVLKRIEAQTARPERVELYLPLRYRRFPGERPALPALPDWVDVIEVKHDLGPATKALPAVKRWREHDASILYFDDDQKYDSTWLARFKAARVERPVDAICERGFNIIELPPLTRVDAPRPRAVKDPNEGKDWLYRVKRAASLGRVKPRHHAYLSSGYIDIAEGNGGVCVKASGIDRRAFDIPDILWTVDDVWISGMLELAGTKIWMNHQGYVQNSFQAVSDSAPLCTSAEQGADRDKANRLCVQYFRDTFDVWR